jgi:transposase
LVAYPTADRVQIPLDNGGIHDSQATQDALAMPESKRLGLHFLPPCSPQ